MPESLGFELSKALTCIDWEQVMLSVLYGPPCFLVREGRFCLRAERWEGHGIDHAYVSLADLLDLIRQQAKADALKQLRAQLVEDWKSNAGRKTDTGLDLAIKVLDRQAGSALNQIACSRCDHAMSDHDNNGGCHTVVQCGRCEPPCELRCECRVSE